MYSQVHDKGAGRADNTVQRRRLCCCIRTYLDDNVLFTKTALCVACVGLHKYNTQAFIQLRVSRSCSNSNLASLIEIKQSHDKLI